MGDHTDTATYFVRAVIRNAASDASLETINLTDRGSRRFSNTWSVPYYTGAIYVIITTTVYTDSGYTTKSENYREEANTYLIAERWQFGFERAGGGVQYEKIREMVEQALKNTRFPEDETTKETLNDIQSAINDIEIPKPQEINLSPVIAAIKNINEKIENIHIPEPEKINLTPIIKNQDRIIDEIKEGTSSISQKTKTQKEEIVEEIIKLNQTLMRFNAILNEKSFIVTLAKDAKIDLPISNQKLDHGILWKEFEKIKR